jgi:two-component system cell cycle sensor histidine kinase/response regulator CckA
VLLVEDEDGVRKFARFALEASGFVVTEAAAAEAALGLIGPDRPLDLLVTDLTMPGMDGRELAGRVRAARPGVGIVFASGYVPENDHFGRVPGAVFLPKPYTPDALLRAAAEALTRIGTLERVAG